MTCKEKLASDRPYLTKVELGYIVKEARPDDYGYSPVPNYCIPFSDECKRCWDREILEKKTPTVEDLLKIIEEKEKEIRILKSKLNFMEAKLYAYGSKVIDDFVNGFAKRKD